MGRRIYYSALFRSIGRALISAKSVLARRDSWPGSDSVAGVGTQQRPNASQPSASGPGCTRQVRRAFILATNMSGSISLSTPSLRLQYSQDVLYDLTSRLAGYRRVPKKCAEVEGPGKHVEYEFHIEIVPHLASSMRPFERLTHGPAPQSENLLADDVGQGRILRHVCHQARQRMPQGPGEGTQKRADRRLKISPNAASVGGWVITHFAEHGIGNEVALTWPTAIEAASSAAGSARNTVYCHRAVPAPS